MCPGHVPGSRSETVRERSTTRAEASAFRSILLLSLECFEKPIGLEAQLLRVGEDADDYLRPASCGSILPFVAYSDDRRAASGGQGGSYDDAPAASRAKGGGELGGDVAPQGRVELLADEGGFAHRARRLEDPLGGEAGRPRARVGVEGDGDLHPGWLASTGGD